MNKSELIEAIANETNETKASVQRQLEATINVITKALKKGDSVTLVGFGSFKTTKRAARMGKNPKTGEALKIPASVVPRFTAGATLKQAVAKKK